MAKLTVQIVLGRIVHESYVLSQLASRTVDSIGNNRWVDDYNYVITRQVNSGSSNYGGGGDSDGGGGSSDGGVGCAGRNDENVDGVQQDAAPDRDRVGRAGVLHQPDAGRGDGDRRRSA